MSVNNPGRSVSGIVLASGMSQRYGANNKLLVRLRGKSVIARTISAYLDAGLARVIVVAGYQADVVSQEIAHLPVDIVLNSLFEEGQSRAMRAGILALGPIADAAIIGVGDQPLLSSTVVSSMADTYRATGARLLVARYRGRRGNPVLFDRSLFHELLAIEGDVGGRPVLERHADEISWIDFSDPRWGMDIDTVKDFETIDRL